MDRRQFLERVVPLACISCLATLGLFRESISPSQDTPPPHKFKDDSQYSFEELFKFAFVKTLLPHLKAVGDEIGRDRLIKIIQSAVANRVRESGQKAAQKSDIPNFTTYTEWARNVDRFWQHVLTFTIIEDTPSAFQIKVTECLWAKTFREAGGEDIGYAVVCNPDFAHANGYSTKLHLVRTKTLMQGHECCNHRWLWNA